MRSTSLCYPLPHSLTNSLTYSLSNVTLTISYHRDPSKCIYVSPRTSGHNFSYEDLYDRPLHSLHATITDSVRHRASRRGSPLYDCLLGLFVLPATPPPSYSTICFAAISRQIESIKISPGVAGVVGWNLFLDRPVLTQYFSIQEVK